MWEWLSTNWWAVWLVAAMLLALTESLTLDFTLLMLAAGALAGAGIALLFPGMILVGMVAVGLLGWATTLLLAGIERRTLAWNVAGRA